MCGKGASGGRDSCYPTLATKTKTSRGWGTQISCLLRDNLVLSFSGLVGDLQVILHAEDAGDGVGADEGDFLVGLVVDRAVEPNIAVLHGDADGLCRVNGVLAQHR